MPGNKKGKGKAQDVHTVSEDGTVEFFYNSHDGKTYSRYVGTQQWYECIDDPGESTTSDTGGYGGGTFQSSTASASYTMTPAPASYSSFTTPASASSVPYSMVPTTAASSSALSYSMVPTTAAPSSSLSYSMAPTTAAPLGNAVTSSSWSTSPGIMSWPNTMDSTVKGPGGAYCDVTSQAADPNTTQNFQWNKAPIRAGFRESGEDMNGVTWNRKFDPKTKQWSSWTARGLEVSAPVQTDYPTILRVVMQKQEGKENHWSIFAAPEGQKGISRHVVGDHTYMQYRERANFNIFTDTAGPITGWVNLIPAMNQAANAALLDAIQRVPVPSAPTQAQVTNDCQTWVYDVVVILVRNGFVQQDKLYELIEQMDGNHKERYQTNAQYLRWLQRRRSTRGY